jgi:hypothetical protein
MRPTPLAQKLRIAPIFIADKVSLAVSREKDGKLWIVYAEWDDYERRSAGRLRASSQGVEWRILPDPSGQNRDPRGGPPFFTAKDPAQHVGRGTKCNDETGDFKGLTLSNSSHAHLMEHSGALFDIRSMSRSLGKAHW